MLNDMLNLPTVYFNVGGSSTVNTSGATYVAYLFRPVTMVTVSSALLVMLDAIKCGSYTPDGSGNGY